MPHLYALRIGIDDYGNRFVNGIRYPKLGGALREINCVHAFLHDYPLVPDEHVITLTSLLLKEKDLWGHAMCAVC